MAKYLVLTVTSTTKVYVDKEEWATEYGLKADEVEQDAKWHVAATMGDRLDVNHPGLPFQVASNSSTITRVEKG